MQMNDTQECNVLFSGVYLFLSRCILTFDRYLSLCLEQVYGLLVLFFVGWVLLIVIPKGNMVFCSVFSSLNLYMLYKLMRA